MITIPAAAIPFFALAAFMAGFAFGTWRTYRRVKQVIFEQQLRRL